MSLTPTTRRGRVLRLLAALWAWLNCHSHGDTPQ